ncbi:hypothetical protein A2U01_0003109 [Trifolium medium]|uniref:Transmembrane protein n=1 Tax=Trifolium medium TaxID=97028 RepID=A0A392M4H7_9FABA|nr:hypothetical protein [Trifolium medium]
MAAPPSHSSGVGQNPSPSNGRHIFRCMFPPLPSLLFVVGLGHGWCWWFQKVFWPIECGAGFWSFVFSIFFACSVSATAASLTAMVGGSLWWFWAIGFSNVLDSSSIWVQSRLFLVTYDRVGALVLLFSVVPCLLRSAGLKASGLPPLLLRIRIRFSPCDCVRTIMLERDILPAALFRGWLARRSSSVLVIDLFAKA